MQDNTTLIYNSIYNLSPKVDENIKSLIIDIHDKGDQSFNRPLTFLPKGLEELKISSTRYNQETDLSQTIIKSFTLFSYYFNKNINISNTLKYLKIRSNNFNKPLNIKHLNLESLILNCDNYDHEIEIPSSLISLFLNFSKYNKTLNLKNTNLQQIELSIYNYNLKFELPSSLTYLSLENIKLNKKLHLPISLKHITINYDVIDNIIFNDKIELNNLEIKYVNIDILKKIQNNIINLEKIFICNNEKINIPFELFRNIKDIKIYSSKYNSNLDNLGNKLEKLHINSDSFNKPLDLLPSSLLKLTLYLKNYTQKLDDLPNLLTYLNLNLNNYSLPIYNLPSSIKELQLNCNSIIKLPTKLEKIYLKKNNIIKDEYYPDNLKLIDYYHDDYNELCDNDLINNKCNIFLDMYDMNELIDNTMIQKYIKMNKLDNFNILIYDYHNDGKSITLEEFMKMYEI